jgi:hypothetical protein
MLSTSAPAVIIPSYRTDWLPPADHEFIRSRYVPLSDDFWVLGGVLPARGGTAHIVRAGRYRVLVLEGANDETYPIQAVVRKGHTLQDSQLRPTLVVDGTVVTTRALVLAAGAHEVICPPDYRPAFVWLGPRLSELPLIGEGDHRTLFVNWY